MSGKKFFVGASEKAARGIARVYLARGYSIHTKTDGGQLIVVAAK